MARSNHTTATTNVASTSDSITNPPNSQNDTQTVLSSGVRTVTPRFPKHRNNQSYSTNGQSHCF